MMMRGGGLVRRKASSSTTPSSSSGVQSASQQEQQTWIGQESGVGALVLESTKRTRPYSPTEAPSPASKRQRVERDTAEHVQAHEGEQPQQENVSDSARFDAEFGTDLGEVAYWNDTMTALQSLRDAYRSNGMQGTGFVLKHQLFTMVEDPTVVERELEELMARGRIRIFKLMLGTDDYAIVSTDEYLGAIARARARLDDEADKATLDAFVKRLLPVCGDISVSRRLVLSAVLGDGSQQFLEEELDAGQVSRVLRVLMNAGLLVHKDTHTFWLAIPGAGTVLTHCRAGRRELLGILRRKKFREMLLKDLVQRRLKRSSLGIMFHVRDLVGSSVATRTSTVQGDLIRLAAKADASSSTSSISSRRIQWGA